MFATFTIVSVRRRLICVLKVAASGAIILLDNHVFRHMTDRFAVNG